MTVANRETYKTLAALAAELVKTKEATSGTQMFVTYEGELRELRAYALHESAELLVVLSPEVIGLIQRRWLTEGFAPVYGYQATEVRAALGEEFVPEEHSAIALETPKQLMEYVLGFVEDETMPLGRIVLYNSTALLERTKPVEVEVVHGNIVLRHLPDGTSNACVAAKKDQMRRVLDL